MRRLAKLASIYEKVADLEWTTFSTVPVDLICQSVAEWKNPEDIAVDYAGISGQDNLDDRRNRYHCVESWRYAILLYCRRVFRNRQDTESLRAIDYLAREILDHVRCIPQTAVVQKQTLLPVFLAGAEAQDEAARRFALEYCRHWSSTAGYNMFATVGAMLEDVWADWNASTRELYWWGVKVNNNAQAASASGVHLPISEFLLG